MRSGRDGSAQPMLPGFEAIERKAEASPVESAASAVEPTAGSAAAIAAIARTGSFERGSFPARPNHPPSEPPPQLEPPPRRFDRALMDRLPDVRDGLTRVERIILWQLGEVQRERGGRNVPSAMLYGRVVEYVNISVPEFERTLARLAGGNDSSFVEGTCAGPGKEGPWRRDPD